MAENDDDVVFIKEEAADIDELISRKISEFQSALPQTSLSAVKIFDDLVRISRDRNASSESALKCAESLSNYIKNAGVFKQRKLADAISYTSLLTKILLLREFRHTLLETFSMEAALSIPVRTEAGNHRGYEIFKKIPLDRPMAMGNNKKGKLGVGSKDVHISEPMPIWLPQDLTISEIYTSGKHTLFLMSNGEFYGSGTSTNFLVEGTEDNLEVPVKLDFVNVAPNTIGNKVHCKAYETGTLFPGYNEFSTLVVGMPAPPDIVLAKGPKWQIVVGNDKKPPDYKAVKVTLHSVLTDKPKFYMIYTDGNWTYDDKQAIKDTREIVFFVCGRRVDSDKFWNAISVCSDGTIYGHYDGTLYSGKLVVGFGKRDKDDDEEHMEEENDVEPGDESIVAFMKEISLPFAVDGFFVNTSGDSMIFYPTDTDKPKTQSVFEKVLAIKSPLSPPVFTMANRESIPYADLLTNEFQTGLEMLTDELINIAYADLPAQREDYTESMYHLVGQSALKCFFTGLPFNGINYIRALRALHHFIRINETVKVPEVLLALDTLDSGDEFEEQLENALNCSIAHGSQIDPIVVNTMGEERTLEIIKKAKIMLERIHNDIMEAIRCLPNLPLRYRRQQRDSQYCNIVVRLINETKTARHFLLTRPRCSVQAFKLDAGEKLEGIVAVRVKREEIDTDEAKKSTIQVQAIATDYCRYNNNGIVAELKSYFYHTNVTPFYLKVIDPSLLEHVEEGVLSLNIVCANNVPKFWELFKLIFSNPKSADEYKKHRKHPNIDNQKICSNLPDSEKYIIIGNDEKEVEVPGYFFQLYTNGFDLGRRNMAEHQGNPTNRMSVSVSAKAVEYLVETLLDPASFYHLDMKFKIEVFQISKELMMLHLEQDLLEMIVMTITESDYDFLASLFEILPESMIKKVGEHRPDIIFHWKKLPFDTENLDTLSKISDEIRKNWFRMGSYCRGNPPPITLASDDGRVDGEKLQKKWLFEQLFKKEQDEDIRWSLTNSIMKWSGYVHKRGMKRCRGCGTL